MGIDLQGHLPLMESIFEELMEEMGGLSGKRRKGGR